VEERVSRVYNIPRLGVIMGETVFTRSLYEAVKTSEGIGDKGVTSRAEQKAKATGKLEPLVDPSQFGVIRLSLPRVEELDDGRWKMLVGCPLPVETRVDTTGSMGGNVDVAMRVLPDAFEAMNEVNEGYDLHVATGIFGDVSDDFVLCRPQFEMHADKIVKQLTMMVPERGGGDAPEDPDAGIFGGAYLCRHFINRIGGKGYDFTVTDAPGRGKVSEDTLIRVFGDKVFEKVEENGHKYGKVGAWDLPDIWSVLLDRAHGFALMVGSGAKSWWEEHVGKERVVVLPNTEHLPAVQATIIGLTEGTLLMDDVADFLKKFNLKGKDIKAVEESVVNIPIGAQAQLPFFDKRPVKGDVFAAKPDVWADENIWPIDGAKIEVSEGETVPSDDEKDDWL
jgi:hypothetical protein